MPLEQRKYLIIAPPRSGNHTATKYYRSLGYDVRLLQLGDDGIVSWFWYKDHSIFDWHFPRRRDYEFDETILLLRDPIKCIRSMSHLLNPLAQLPALHFDVMEELLGEPLPMDSLKAAIIFWTTIVQDAVYDKVVYLEDWNPSFHVNPHPYHKGMYMRDLMNDYSNEMAKAMPLIQEHNYPTNKNHYG